MDREDQGRANEKIGLVWSVKYLPSRGSVIIASIELGVPYEP